MESLLSANEQAKETSLREFEKQVSQIYGDLDNFHTLFPDQSSNTLYHITDQRSVIQTVKIKSPDAELEQ